ncbi:hypothetical protein ACFZDJ_54750 [Streptomyces sp. NPDC007896]|uniref:hypothetical protein n=1 Tax=unclassified Streptomyces TaxID=2593676 RepID=UPI0036F07AF2
MPQELQAALTVREITRRVVAAPFTRDANTPHTGQALAEASAVARWTRRVPSSSRSSSRTQIAQTGGADGADAVLGAGPLAVAQ